jgi:hypothetical protein
MDVEVRSPDRTVTLRLSGSGDIQVDLAEGTLARHSEESLGRQVSAAVRLAIAARARAYEQAFNAVAGRYVES